MSYKSQEAPQNIGGSSRVKEKQKSTARGCSLITRSRTSQPRGIGADQTLDTSFTLASIGWCDSVGQYDDMGIPLFAPTPTPPIPCSNHGTGGNKRTAAKALVRSGLRCACHFFHAWECPLRIFRRGFGGEAPLEASSLRGGEQALGDALGLVPRA